jgi:mono/diheme cytochrome c family protein
MSLSATVPNLLSASVLTGTAREVLMRIAAGAAGGEAGASNLRAKVHAMLRQRAKAWLLGSIGIVLAGAGYLQAASLAVPRPAMAGQAGEALYVEAPQQAPSPSVGPPAAQYRALLDRYCVTCHNERTRVADLALDTTDIDHVGQGAEVWEKVARKLRTRAMPPLGRPRPDETAYNAFASWLETALDRAAVASPDPGRRPAVHRLNRAEYTNAIRDLLGLNIDSGSLLPPDDSGYGFDNIADVLSVSPTLTERYLSAARKISRLAVGDPTLQPATDTFAVNKYLKQDGRLSEDLPFGSRGGLAVKKHGDGIFK